MTSPRALAHPHRRWDAFIALDDEWSRLRSRPTNVRHAAAWGIVDDPADLDDVVVACGGTSRRTPSIQARLSSTDRDERFAELVRHARHDQLAGRVALQRLVPSLMQMVSAVSRQRGTFIAERSATDLVTAAWEAIVSADTSRAGFLAQRLLASARLRAIVPERRRWTCEPVPPWTLDEVDDRDADSFTSLVHVLDEARLGGVDADDIELLATLVAAPLVLDAARVLRVTPRTIRNRRTRAVAAVRAAVV